MSAPSSCRFRAPLPMSHGETGFLRVADAPLSTVPTCSAYPDSADGGTLKRLERVLASHRLPMADAVRADQIINALPYGYPAPAAGEQVSINLEVAGCPWEPGHRLVRIGLRVADPVPATRPTTTTDSPDLLGIRVGVEFNPAVAGAYRLIGYEPEGETGGEVRFESDPAGNEAGGEGRLASGRTMTVLYEVVPSSDVLDSFSPLRGNPMKYQRLAPVSTRRVSL